MNLRIKTYFRSIKFSTPRKDNPNALLTAYYYTAVKINNSVPDAGKVYNEHPFHRLTDRCSEGGRYTCSMQCAQRVAPITMTANPSTESTKRRLPFHHMTGNKYDACSKTWRGKRREDTFFPNYRTQVRPEWMKTRTSSFDPRKHHRRQKWGDTSWRSNAECYCLQRGYQYVLESRRIADPKPHHRDNIQTEEIRREWVCQNTTVFVFYLLGWRHVSATVGHPQVTKIYNEENIYSIRTLVVVPILSFQRDLVV